MNGRRRGIGGLKEDGGDFCMIMKSMMADMAASVLRPVHFGFSGGANGVMTIRVLKFRRYMYVRIRILLRKTYFH